MKNSFPSAPTVVPTRERPTVNLSLYQTTHDPQAGKLKMILWYFTNIFFFQNPFNPSSGLKVRLLRLFGAKIGQGVVVKPAVNIKYPWKLTVGKEVWIGENVWIDNLEPVSIGNNVCISQGALLLTGGHDITAPDFSYESGSIQIEDGCWIGARAVVSKNVTCGSHSVLGINAVAESDLQAYFVYKGNPAIPILERQVKQTKSPDNQG
jgi:putative colanic acid biosynthesis acetyltransferase WcaF